jgi:hypothetical protein
MNRATYAPIGQAGFSLSQVLKQPGTYRAIGLHLLWIRDHFPAVTSLAEVHWRGGLPSSPEPECPLVFAQAPLSLAAIPAAER